MGHHGEPIAHYMVSPVRTVYGRTSLREVSHILSEFRLSALPVVDDDHRIIGVISLTDMIRLGSIRPGDSAGQSVLEIPDDPVALAMTPDPLTVSPNMSVPRVARMLLRRRIHRVFVTEGEQLIGVLAMRDLVRVVASSGPMAPVSEYMNDLAVTMPATASVPDAISRLETSQLHAIVVLRNGKPVGTFTQKEAVTARQTFEHAQVDDVMNTSFLCLPIDTPTQRAAHQAVVMKPSIIIAMEGDSVRGVLSPTDFAFAAM